MLQQLLARWRLWEQALEGMDDPQGDYLLNLEERVCRLERRSGAFAQAGGCSCRGDAAEVPGD